MSNIPESRRYNIEILGELIREIPAIVELLGEGGVLFESKILSIQVRLGELDEVTLARLIDEVIDAGLASSAAPVIREILRKIRLSLSSAERDFKANWNDDIDASGEDILASPLPQQQEGHLSTPTNARFANILFLKGGGRRR
jgi:hypothetical protein